MTTRVAASPREFAGFRVAARTFLRRLRRHNDREWFAEHRPTYEAEVRDPLAALVEDVDVRLASFAPEIVGDPRRSLFRIHRDVRFSADKSPYKTSAACWFFHAGAGRGVGSALTAHGGAGFYFEFGPSASSIGGGIWMPPPPTLRIIRARIGEEHASLARLLRTPALRRYGGLVEDAMLARMPRGYAMSHAAASLLRHRSFTVGRALTDEELFSARLPDVLARDFARILPLVRWLNGALGLRTLARR